MTRRIVILALAAALLLTGCALSAEPTQPPAEPTLPPEIVAVCELAVLPESWDALAEQTAETEFLRSLTGGKLYAVATDGSEIVPHMAAALPVDVTAEYAGQYGLPADAARGYAFRIDLNEAACWEDGTPITADDYLNSVETLLADETQAVKILFLANAQELLSGKELPAEEVVSLQDAGFGSVAAAKEAGATEFYLNMEVFWGLGDGWQSVTDRTRFRDHAMPSGLKEQFVSAAYLYDTYLAEGAAYSYLQTEFVGISADLENKVTFADVGIRKTGEYQLTLMLAQPHTAEALALKLADFPLVTGGGRSCGPYRLVSADSTLIQLERNENWWGDGTQYEADILKIRAS